MKTFGVAVVGCGVMGAQHIAVVNNNDRCKVVGVVDNKAERAKDYAARFGIPSFSTQYSDFFQRKDVDIIIIATRPTNHDRIAIEALRAGKHVLCEKPMAASLDGARSIIAAAKDTGKKILIGFILRHSKLYQKAAVIAQGAKIGRPLVMRLFGGEHNIDDEAWQENLRLLKDTSPVIDCGSHYVDVMRWFSGAEIETVSGVGTVTEVDVPAGFNNYEIITLNFSDGSVGTYDVGWGRTFRDFSVKEFIGPKGRIRLTYRTDRCEFREEGDLIELYTHPDRYEIINVKEPFLDWAGQFQFLIDMIEYDHDPLPTLSDAYRSLEAVLAGHRSIVERKTYTL